MAFWIVLGLPMAVYMELRLTILTQNTQYLVSGIQLVTPPESSGLH